MRLHSVGPPLGALGACRSVEMLGQHDHRDFPLGLLGNALPANGVVQGTLHRHHTRHDPQQTPLLHRLLRPAGCLRGPGLHIGGDGLERRQRRTAGCSSLDLQYAGPAHESTQARPHACRPGRGIGDHIRILGRVQGRQRLQTVEREVSAGADIAMAVDKARQTHALGNMLEGMPSLVFCASLGPVDVVPQGQKGGAHDVRPAPG